MFKSQSRTIIITSLFIYSILIIGCNGPNPIQGCATYNSFGYCFEGGQPVAPAGPYTVCADSESEAIDVGSAMIAYYNKCSAGAVTAMLINENFCELNEDPNDKCKATGNKTSALMAYKSPYSTFDGLVDPNLTWLTFTNLDDNDTATVNVEGEVSVIGGDCLGSGCPLEITHAFLQSSKPFSLSGKQITELRALNHGIWSGYKWSNDTLSINSPSYISISGKLDGNYTSVKAKAETHVKGKFQIVFRNNGSKNVGTNSLIIDGSFLENNVHVKMHLHIWMADCRPEIVAEVSCVTGIEYEPLYVRLDVPMRKMLSNIDQKDFCNAYKTKNISTDCGSDPEQFIPCFKGSEYVTGKLDYRWEDANGDLIGKNPLLHLKNCPTFPITLNVINEWGHITKKVIGSPTNLGKCSKLCQPKPKILKINPTKCDDPIYVGIHLDECSHFKELLKRDVDRFKKIRDAINRREQNKEPD